MASDHIGPEAGIARDYAYYPGTTSGFGLGFAVRTSVPPNTSWPLGEYRWGRRRRHVSSSLIPRTTCFAIFMVQTPSQPRTHPACMKALIYQGEGEVIPYAQRTIFRGPGPTVSSICG